jgi:hypothetical protein
VVQRFAMCRLGRSVAVRASAFDVDWKNVGRFVSEHGCEAAITMISGRWTDEALAIAREAGKRYGCSWAVEKGFGLDPNKKCSSSELQEAVNASHLILNPFETIGIARRGTFF